MVGDEGLLRGYLRDGLVHFRVDYAGEIDDLHKKAFQAGMDIWNRHSHLTGFAFEMVTKKTMAVDFHLKAGPPDVRATTKKGEPNEETDCAGYMASHIWYSTKNKDWLTGKADLANAAKVYVQELGHALNLGHGNTTSVMREGNKKLACGTVALGLPEITEADAKEAHICGCAARLMAQGQELTP